jgi:hypothetical protein
MASRFGFHISAIFIHIMTDMFFCILVTLMMEFTLSEDRQTRKYGLIRKLNNATGPLITFPKLQAMRALIIVGVINIGQSP